MSLELKIETLTAAINALNVNIAKLVNVPMCDNPELAAAILDRELPTPTHVIEDIESEGRSQRSDASFTNKLTHKELQDLIMLMVREDMKRKPGIKALLAKHSASKVSDLDADNLEAFKAELVKL
jgi:hypothetical protein